MKKILLILIILITTSSLMYGYGYNSTFGLSNEPTQEESEHQRFGGLRSRRQEAIEFSPRPGEYKTGARPLYYEAEPNI